MRPRIYKSPYLSIARPLGGVICLLVWAVVGFAGQTSRVVVRDDMRPAHKTELLEKLRAITGWRELSFDRNGFLVTGEVDSAGSESARALIASAIHGNQLIVLEDATDRADVAFCRVVPGRTTGSSVSPIPIFVVLIDFRDFQHVTGDARARAAFDVGWGFLHELDHVVSQSKDAENMSAAGECEDHINQMRRELGLPVRSTYFFSSLPVKTDPNFITRLVRLGFTESDPSHRRPKHYWLVWDAALVGGIDERSLTALIRSADSK
ncbi:MAG: hypothetical protein C5B55_03790, partial [Blastocatellia bacterium]